MFCGSLTLSDREAFRGLISVGCNCCFSDIWEYLWDEGAWLHLWIWVRVLKSATQLYCLETDTFWLKKQACRILGFSGGVINTRWDSFLFYFPTYQYRNKICLGTFNMFQIFTYPVDSIHTKDERKVQQKTTSFFFFSCVCECNPGKVLESGVSLC